MQETWQADFVPPSIIDITRLTEEDYTRIHHAARQQLGLVGTVRTRTDVHEYLDEDPRIRTDLTDAQREVATEVILHRYQQFQDEPDHGADNDAAVFARIVDEVTDFLDLTDAQPGWASTPTAHRPSRSSRAD